MKISIICNSYPTRKNPLNQVFIKNISEEFSKNGNDVTVSYNKLYDLWDNPTDKKSFISKIVKFIFSITSILLFALNKSCRKSDVLFSHAIMLPTFYSVVLKKIFGIPVVAYVHGGDINDYFFSGVLYKYVLKYSLDNSDAIIVNSTDIEFKVKSISDNPEVYKISPGIDLDRMKEVQISAEERDRLAIPQDKKVIMSAGNAIKRKGFDILIKAVNEIDSEAKKELYVILIAEGPEVDSLLYMINKFNLANTISVRAKVPQDDLVTYYNIADVFIFPSREEPLGLVGLEAMACGTMVIGSNIGGIKEYIKNGENGFLFEVDDYIKLSELITYTTTNNNKFDSWEKELENTVKEHSLNNSFKKMKSVLKNVQEK